MINEKLYWTLFEGKPIYRVICVEDREFEGMVTPKKGGIYNVISIGSGLTDEGEIVDALRLVEIPPPDSDPDLAFNVKFFLPFLFNYN